MADLLTTQDLIPFADIDSEKADAMVEDVLALAIAAVPALAAPTFTNQAAAKAVLRGIVLRWNEAGSASYQAQMAEPPGSLAPRPARRNSIWDSEIKHLRELVGQYQGGVYSVSLAGPDPLPLT